MKPMYFTEKEAEQAKREQAVAEERFRWWRLEETAGRCKQIAERLWDAELQRAGEEQQAIAETLRDRHAIGTRATTGQPYEIDKGLMVPVLTPYDRLAFLEKVAVSYMISADRQNLPVTKAGRRETQPDEVAQAVDEALEVEAGALAEAGEAAQVEAGGLAVSEAPAS